MLPHRRARPDPPPPPRSPTYAQARLARRLLSDPASLAELEARLSDDLRGGCTYAPLVRPSPSPSPSSPSPPDPARPIPPSKLPWCGLPPRFEVTARGYPAPLARVCAQHLGPLLDDDASVPGSTLCWQVDLLGPPSTDLPLHRQLRRLRRLLGRAVPPRPGSLSALPAAPAPSPSPSPPSPGLRLVLHDHDHDHDHEAPLLPPPSPPPSPQRPGPLPPPSPPGSPSPPGQLPPS